MHLLFFIEKKERAKEVAKRLHTILAKGDMFVDKCHGKGKGVLRVENCRKVNIWGKLMEDKGYFGKVCLCRPISVLTFCLQ